MCRDKAFGDLVRALATPHVLDSLERRVGITYPDGADETIDGDERRARYVARMIEWKKPALTLAYLTALDHEQHVAGPWTPRAFAVLERIDAALDTIVQAAHRTFGDRATIAVVSDHGFVPVATEVDIDVALAQAGLIDLPAGESAPPSAWRAASWVAGGVAAIVLRDSADADARSKTRTVLASLAADSANGIAAIVDRAELDRWGAFPNVECVVAFRPGFVPGTAVRGEVRRRASVAGMHGFLPVIPGNARDVHHRGTWNHQWPRPGPHRHARRRTDVGDVTGGEAAGGPRQRSAGATVAVSVHGLASTTGVPGLVAE